ncbi:MAG: pyridoxal-phosphate-dependent aminotransferase family protein [Opitutales bacterium]
MAELFDQINPPPRLMMGPGPINADPRVLRAMSAQLLGQYDPAFRENMRETQVLFRQIFETDNEATLLIDGTSRSAIEACIVSLIEPGDVVLVPVFGRFGHLLTEISERVGADVRKIECEWGEIFTDEQIEAALIEHKPKLLAVCQGDTSTTMCQPLNNMGKLAHKHGALVYVDATASIVGNPLPVDAWELDAVSVGLQKCLGGPSGSAPITLSPAAVEVIKSRWHVEKGIQPAGFVPGTGSRIRSNYLDLAQIISYWETGLNHHTEATSMLYCARECARINLQEGLEAVVARHKLGSDAMVAGLQAMGLEVYGDLEFKMLNVTGVYIPEGIPGDELRATMLDDFGIEIGTSFGPLHGKIWRIGNMGYNCRKEFILQTLAALASALQIYGFELKGDGVAAAYAVYKAAGQVVGS